MSDKTCGYLYIEKVDSPIYAIGTNHSADGLYDNKNMLEVWAIDDMEFVEESIMKIFRNLAIKVENKRVYLPFDSEINARCMCEYIFRGL